ncbi:MAG: glycoside hydrolase family 57 protein [Candidatus Aenigmarchaeota archaeon]|nr:glycoside hydrolase family 57 protein [Candidatus Aenigmarchaeota archaeon]
MTSITFTFKVHQPIRLKKLNVNEINGFDYFDTQLNKFYLDKIAKKCYFPTNLILLNHLEQFKHEKKKFKVSFSISGVFLEACEKFDKDLLDSFRQLVDTGEVELLAEPYYHSLASLFERKDEFIEQIRLHYQMMKDLFNFKPRVFMNTEMIYNNLIAKTLEEIGFKAVFTEGIERILNGKSPNYIYIRRKCFQDDLEHKERIRVLLRNYRLSDDIGYRFSARWWNEWPLTADKYAAWLSATPGDCINIALDYETFGEHHWEDSGIFWFLRALPYEIFKHLNLEILTPSEVVKKFKPKEEIDVFEFSTVSWADMERDVSAWLHNPIQQACFGEIKAIENKVKSTNNQSLIKIWRLLQQSDHLYYLCTKSMNDGDVHRYFANNLHPQDGFLNFIKIINDFKLKLDKNTSINSD